MKKIIGLCLVGAVVGFWAFALLGDGVLQNVGGLTSVGGSTITGTAITNGFTPAASLAGGLTVPSVTVTGSVPGTVTLNDASGNLRAVLGTNDNFLLTNAVTSKTIKGTNGTVTAFAFVGDGSGLTGISSGGATTIVQTNFVLNTVYTNGSQAIQAKAKTFLHVAAVAGGVAEVDLYADQAGGTTFAKLDACALDTTVLSIVMDYTNCHLICNLSPNATYYFTNTSTGTGNTGALLAGTGQTITISSGTNGATGATGATGPSGSQTPWSADINAAGFSATNLNNLTATGTVSIAAGTGTNYFGTNVNVAGTVNATGFTNSGLTASTITVSDAGKGQASLANGGNNTLLHGTFAREWILVCNGFE